MKRFIRSGSMVDYFINAFFCDTCKLQTRDVNTAAWKSQIYKDCSDKISSSIKWFRIFTCLKIPIYFYNDGKVIIEK